MTERIDSPGNKKIKLAASLHHRKTRDKEGLFIVEGVRLAEMAAASSWEIVFGLCTRTAAAEPRVQKILAALAARQCPVYETDEDIYKKAAATVAPQGLLLVMKQQQTSLRQVLSAEEQPLLLVLDGVTDPHNLGACLRVADGAGAHAVIAPKDHAAGINATVAKVASGAAETVPYFMVTNLARTLNELKERSIWVTGTSDDAERTLYDVDFKGPTALVLGAEGAGMRQLTRKTCDQLVRIPMMGAVESLNVSVASGVCLYEARRQRGV